MKMKKTLFSTIALLLFLVPVLAQENASPFLTMRDKILRAQLTITPGWNLGASLGGNSASISGGRTNIYLHGTLEYYMSEAISIRGDAFYLLNKNKKPGGMNVNECVQTGVSWHLRKEGAFDPYVGIAAGINTSGIRPMDFYKAPGDTLFNVVVPTHMDPIWGPRIGVNYYGEKMFHFFIEAHYLIGTFRPVPGPMLSLNELRVSAGLGWNWAFATKEANLRPTL
jgi:hypothetical protein